MNVNSNPRELVIFFDGLCIWCSRWVDFCLKNDEGQRLRFATKQGKTFAQLVQQRPELGEVGSVVVWGGEDEIWIKSEATAKILAQLPGALGWMGRMQLAAYRIVPPTRWLADFIYGIIARNRYRWFGKRDACRVPTEAERARFLE